MDWDSRGLGYRNMDQKAADFQIRRNQETTVAEFRQA
jgi:hypothetical protein